MYDLRWGPFRAAAVDRTGQSGPGVPWFPHSFLSVLSSRFTAMACRTGTL